MANTMTIKEFNENKNEAMEFIANILRNEQSYEDGLYYLHLVVEGEDYDTIRKSNVGENLISQLPPNVMLTICRRLAV